ncbi:MAG TPA: hypothetical protein VES61_07660 [Gaiellaceae bacterium]|nr:hypothetical protein [Gaiellaceae bacterium]
MRKLVLAVPVALLVLVLVACGAGEPGDPGDSEGGSPPAPAPVPVYEADLTVLEQRAGSFPKHGPMLCLGAMAMSYPPQCGDVPIANWNWDTVEGEETASGTSWGQYHVVGTYDGETFTVTEVGPYEDDPSRSGSEVDFSSPCQEPAGGWVVPDPKGATQEDVRGASAYAESQPDIVNSWVTHLDPGLAEFSPVIFNAVFTGDTKGHDAEIRKRWLGPLCVVEAEGPTKRELNRIRAQAETYVTGELGLQMLGSSSGGVEPVIEIEVVADPDGAGQAALDARWPGLVRLFPALRSVGPAR